MHDHSLKDMVSRIAEIEREKRVIKEEREEECRALETVCAQIQAFSHMSRTQSRCTLRERITFAAGGTNLDKVHVPVMALVLIHRVHICP